MKGAKVVLFALSLVLGSVNREIQTEAEKEQNIGLMVKYPAEGKARKDHHKKLKKGETSPIEDS